MRTPRAAISAISASRRARSRSMAGTSLGSTSKLRPPKVTCTRVSDSDLLFDRFISIPRSWTACTNGRARTLSGGGESVRASRTSEDQLLGVLLGLLVFLALLTLVVVLFVLVVVGARREPHLVLHC